MMIQQNDFRESTFGPIKDNINLDEKLGSKSSKEIKSLKNLQIKTNNDS